MKLLVAKTSGFCMGVRRAVEMVLDAPEKHAGPICTYGPLIHNPQVLELLESKGISAIKEIPVQGTGTILIRAHGVPLKTKKTLKAAGFKVLDATCPRVIKVQSIIRKHARQDYASIIIGDKDHPEVVGLLGYAGDNGFVAGTLEELAALPAFDKAIIVAQTTQNTHFFAAVQSWAAANYPHYKIFKTICDSTARRQSEVQHLAESVDAIFIVGGRSSGNTQRLAEIARLAGKPAYHIETEADLDTIDLSALTGARNIGITAGASTPNWITKKVYRALESLLIKRKKGWQRILFESQRVLLLTNMYVSIGAGCLSYACSMVQGVTQFFPYIFISILYVQSMHILNNLTGSRADRYNDPERAGFYKDNKPLLNVLAITSGAAGLLTAFWLGLLPFLILLIMSILGLSYNLQLIPRHWSRIKYKKIRNIPGSKTVLIAMAWGIVTAVVPPLSEYGTISWTNAMIFLWAAGIVFVRTAIFDILDMQGDRIVGKETIPVLLGEKKSIQMLNILLVILIAILLVSSAFHFISYLGFALVLCLLFLMALLAAYARGVLLPSIKLEFMVETNFVMAGAITLLWSLLVI
jgi:4-hydroxy-3-methylbut-2-enyl diphosphate reductase